MYDKFEKMAAFIRPEKPEDVDKKSAYIIGGGIAGMTTAFYLLRDGQIKGEHIHILEKQHYAGGCFTGCTDGSKRYFMCGDRGMDAQYDVMWDVFREVPTLENPHISVLDEIYRLIQQDPNYSQCRSTEVQGCDTESNEKILLDKESAFAIGRLAITPDEELESKTILEMLPDSFWQTNMWLYWQSAFGLCNRSSALEMKKSIGRYICMADGFANSRSFCYAKRDPYESLILPLENYLHIRGVQFSFDMNVKNIRIEENRGKKTARQILYEKDGLVQSIDLIEDDLVFVTIGSCLSSASCGDQNTAPIEKSGQKENGWELWKAIAAQSESKAFGDPVAFSDGADVTSGMYAIVETDNEEIIRRIMNISRRDPRAGKTTTGGPVTVRDTADNWLLSWSVDRQPRFRDQNRNCVIINVSGIYTDRLRKYVQKPMHLCTGEEICREWLFHIGIPEEKILPLAADSCYTTICYLPYLRACLKPCEGTDRPKVVPDGCVNLAFIGQFAQTQGMPFTWEYSMRSGMEAVYTLLNINRQLPESMSAQYDIRYLLRACNRMLDGKSLSDFRFGFREREAVKLLLRKFSGTEVEAALYDSGMLS